MFAVVDAGPLYAAVDRDDQDHDACLVALSRPDLRLVIPAMVIAEATYLIGRRLGAQIESQFLDGLTTFDVEAPTPDDWQRIGQLVAEYADFPLGGTDASVVALAERLDTRTVITLDRRHFNAVRPLHCKAFDLLPA